MNPDELASPEFRRVSESRVRRRRPALLRRSRRLMAAATGAFVAASLLLPGSAAFAVEYPTWDEVSAARDDVSNAESMIRQIESQLAALEAEAARTQAEAEIKGAVWKDAELKFQAAAAKTRTLQQQADTASATAEISAQRAGQMAAQIARASGDGFAVGLWTSSEPEELLDALGIAGRLTQQSQAAYERAILDRNTAQALTDQAEVASAELELLKLTAEEAFAQAQTAANSAQLALQLQLDNQARMTQQLLVLRERRAATEADYLAGVRERIAAAPSLDAGEISDSGWVRPSGGYITSPFGWRTDPWYSFHTGTDLGASCGANIYAATGGTVIYAGWSGGYGNYVLIDHGNGLRTAYAHIAPGGILVSNGQRVEIAQNIAKVGTTGNSTGCHLHYEVLVNGIATDPATFMADRGIRIG